MEYLFSGRCIKNLFVSYKIPPKARLGFIFDSTQVFGKEHRVKWVSSRKEGGLSLSTRAAIDSSLPRIKGSGTCVMVTGRSLFLTSYPDHLESNKLHEGAR